MIIQTIIFFNFNNDLALDIKPKISLTLWEPQWIKKVGNKHITVSCKEVNSYYLKLNVKDPKLAHAFLQINEHENLNSIVPYRELREELLKSNDTRNLVNDFRNLNLKSPIYIAFMDADVISFRTGKKGVFSYYEEAIISNKEILHGITTGYSVSFEQNPFVSLAVYLDLAVRQALSTIYSLAPYYPEPNAIIRVLDKHDTLEISFPGLTHYTSPQEIPLLIREIVKQRFKNSNIQAALHFKFLSEGAIETEMPIRFLQNRKKKDGTKI